MNMGRQIDPKHLLDTDADQNIGNSTLLQPQPGSVATVIAATNPARLFQLNGPSKTAQTVSVVFTASRIVGQDNPNPGYAGPITGILEFGNGGRFTKVEFDVPVGPFLGNFQGAVASSEPQDGGVIVTVPSGVLRAYARYDNLLVQPALGLPTQSTAQLLGVPFVGPGGPVQPPAPPIQQAPAEPVLVKAMAAYYTRHFARAYKTQYCYVGSPGFIAQWIPNGKAVYCVPAFARTVKLLRWNSNVSTTPSMTLQFFDGINFLEEVAIPAGTPSPTLDLVGNETIIQVLSSTPADTITFLALCYEIGI
jgi:hypothetical protein